jgi:hypothetical protein
MDFRIERLGTGPIIRPDMDAMMGTNINGPSLIRAPDWLANPLGRYYLYFAHHNGSYIRLAVADAAEGPWRTHEDGVLDLADSYFIDHIASPEVFVDDAAKSIRLYFHGRTGYKPDGGQIQGTRVGESSDGLTFTVREPLLGPAYFRIFRQDGAFYAFARTAELLCSPDGFQPFESLGIPNGFPEAIRHVALWRRSETEMTIFHTVIGESPEVIYTCPFRMDGDPSDWWAGNSIEIMRPEFDYEGVDLPLIPSERGAIDIRANQLRDPDIFVDDDGTIYMPYGIAGEAGIALTKITKEL